MNLADPIKKICAQEIDNIVSGFRMLLTGHPKSIFYKNYYFG